MVSVMGPLREEHRVAASSTAMLMLESQGLVGGDGTRLASVEDPAWQ